MSSSMVAHTIVYDFINSGTSLECPLTVFTPPIHTARVLTQSTKDDTVAVVQQAPAPLAGPKLADNESSIEAAQAFLARNYPSMKGMFKLAVVDDLMDAASACDEGLVDLVPQLYAETLGHVKELYCGMRPAEQLERLVYLLQYGWAKTRDAYFFQLSPQPAFVSSGQPWPKACNVEFNAVVKSTVTEHHSTDELLCVSAQGV